MTCPSARAKLLLFYRIWRPDAVVVILISGRAKPITKPS